MENMEKHREPLYANNAMTSWPKPDAVREAMIAGLECPGSNLRGEGVTSREAGRLLAAARKKCADFLGIGNPDNLMFVPSATYGMNLILGGYLHPDDAVVVARAEHNAVLRPLFNLQESGVDLAWAPMAPGGFIDLAELEQLLEVGVAEGRPFAAVICRHASNVSGAIQPIEDVALLAHQYDAMCISDGAQAAGHLPVNLDRSGIDAWTCSGHKGLLGPKGVGLMYLADGFELKPTIFGGTGSGDADDICAEAIKPICFEPGTEPLPAILGLHAGVEWLSKHPDAMKRTALLGTQLRTKLDRIAGIRVLGPSVDQPHLPIVSLVADNLTPTLLGATLEKDYGIVNRVGLHCAPDAARVLGVYPEGSVRLSLGPFNTQTDVDEIVAAVAEIVG
jgi:selenocysteine lyase/cysteine desulfurase